MSDIPKLVPVRMAASVSQQRRHIADVVRGVGRLPLHCGASRRNGVFPANTYQAHACPVLVDRDGTRCAVAHLMGKTGAGDLVLKLGRWDRFVWVEDIEDREVAGLVSVGRSNTTRGSSHPAGLPTKTEGGPRSVHCIAGSGDGRCPPKRTAGSRHSIPTPDLSDHDRDLNPRAPPRGSRLA